MRWSYKLERLPLPSLFSLAYYPKILDKAGKEKRSSLFCRTVGDKEGISFYDIGTWLTLRCSSLGLGEPLQTVKFGHENISRSEFGVNGVTGASDGSKDGTLAADDEEDPSDDPVDMRLLRFGTALA